MRVAGAASGSLGALRDRPGTGALTTAPSSPQVRRECQRLEALGKGLGPTPAGLPVLTEVKTRALPGGCDAEAREQFLLHGTKPETLLAILANGPNERFSSGLFGNGTYCASLARGL